MSDQVRLAREFAVRAHRTQRYGAHPYAHHLASVVAILEDAASSEEVLVAGWLHDVIEDTAATMEEVENAFGLQVAQLVDAVSGGGPRAEHVSSIYRKIATCPRAATVKLADRIANVEAAQPGDEHSTRYAREHLGFAEVVQPHVPHGMWQRYLSALQSKTRATEHSAADVSENLERKGAPSVSIEEIKEAGAKGWAGEP